MVLGNPIPNWDPAVFGRNTCPDIQGLACKTSVLRSGFNRRGLRSFPKDSVFSQGAHVRAGP